MGNAIVINISDIQEKVISDMFKGIKTIKVNYKSEDEKDEHYK